MPLRIRVFKKILSFLLAFFVFYWSFFYSFSVKQILAADGLFPYDWEVKGTGLNADVTLNLPADSLPDGTLINFSIFKRLSGDSDKFNMAGVQGVWDLQTNLTDCYGQVADRDAMLDKHFAMLASLKIGWANLSFSWPWMQNDQTRIKFDKYDKVFRIAKKYDIKLLPNIVNTPRWASGIPCEGITCKETTRCVPGDLIRNRDQGQIGSTNYNNFVKKLVERYQPHGNYFTETGESDNGYGITHWVIWNEPDNTGDIFWGDCARLSPTPPPTQEIDDQQVPKASMSDYADLFTGAYKTIKEINTNAKVIMSGLSYSTQEGNPLQQFYDRINNTNGHKPDILNIHAYIDCYLDRPDRCLLRDFLNAFLNKRDELDSGKEVWLTEFAAPYFPFNEIKQKDFVLKALPEINYLADRNLKKAFWWDSKGYSCDPQEAGTRLGLMQPNFYPRLAFLEFGRLLGNVSPMTGANTTVSNNRIQVIIPGSRFITSGQYIVVPVSKMKIVTLKPIAIFAGMPVPTEEPSPTPSRTPTPTSAATATNTPIPNCSCQTNNPYNKCSSGCLDSSNTSISGFACVSNLNCSNNYSRTKGDATGDNKTCLDDYNKYFSALYGLITGEEKIKVDFNGNNFIDDGDLQIFRDNYRPQNCGQSL